MINKFYTLQNKSYKFVNKFHNAIDIEIFINKFHRNGMNLKIGFILEHENADDRTVFEKGCLLLQVDTPFLYAKKVKVI